MKNISFDEGYREFKLNGDDSRVIRIRLSDPNLLNRIQNAMDRIDELAEKYKGQKDPELIPELNEDVKNFINDAFGSDICTPAFGSASPFTVLPDGQFLFSAFFDAFLPVLKEDMKIVAKSLKANKQVRKEVQKYLEPVSVAPMSAPIAGLAKPPVALPDVSGLTDEQKRQLIAQLI